jgi:hypothetical protein
VNMGETRPDRKKLKEKAERKSPKQEK